MGWNTIKEDWQRHVGEVRILWSRLTEDELQEIKGRRDVLVNKIREKYQLPEDLADEQVRVFESRYDDPNPVIEVQDRGTQKVPGVGKTLGGEGGP